MKITSSKFSLPLNVCSRLLAVIFLLSAFQATLQAQHFDFETCWGDPTAPNLCTGKDAEQVGVQYEFPQVFNCNADALPSAVEITPSDAGVVLGVISSGEISGSKPKVCIQWLKPGFHQVKVFYKCGLGYLETRTRTVYVSLFGVNYANFTVSNVSNCPTPFSSFTVSRSTVGSGPLKQNRVLLYTLDGSGNITGSPVFDTNWRNGNFISETFNNSNGGINFTAGTRYKVRFQTRSACGTDDVIGNTIIVGQANIDPSPNFTINGSSTFPANLYSCNNSPMILNDATVFSGCNPNITQARIEIERASDCNSSISGTKLTQNVAYASSYNLRTLFPAYTSTADLYRITYSLQGNTGLITGATRCVQVNSLDASNAEFLLKAPNNGMPLNRTTTDPTAANQKLGGSTAGLYLTNTTSLVSSLDYYRVEIWLTSGGSNVQQILNSGQICLDTDPNTSNCIDYPLGYDFNPPTNGYFFSLTSTEKTNNRYRVRLTVHNQCGESFQESFFRIDPNCTFCLTDKGGDEGALQNGVETEDRDYNVKNVSQVAVSVRPNPTTGILNIVATLQGEGLAEFNIYDQSGREVAGFQRNMESASFRLDENLNLESLPAGIYWWRFIANGQLQTGRVAKN